MDPWKSYPEEVAKNLQHNQVPNEGKKAKRGETPFRSWKKKEKVNNKYTTPPLKQKGVEPLLEVGESYPEEVAGKEKGKS